MDNFSSAIKDQLLYNKKIESQLEQLSATPPFATNHEQVKAITTRGGKSTRDPPYPKGTGRTPTSPVVLEEKKDNEEEEVAPQELQDQMRQDFHDTNFLPFPHRNRRVHMDEQFGKFVEVIQRLYINMPLLDAIQVPTYAKYLKDILNKKRPLPTTEVIKLTEECSTSILNITPTKKKDPGCPTIDYSIGDQHFSNALCDLGASVSVMPKTAFDNLTYSTLEPTSMCIQLADQSIRYPVGIAENIPVKIRDFFVPVDFVVLDMQPDSKVSLNLGRPFLSTANAHINVGAGEIRFIINGKEECFTFRPKPELNLTTNMVWQEKENQSSGSSSPGSDDAPKE
jgi:hypothetical protein